MPVIEAVALAVASGVAGSTTTGGLESEVRTGSASGSGSGCFAGADAAHARLHATITLATARLDMMPASVPDSLGATADLQDCRPKHLDAILMTRLERDPARLDPIVL